MGKWPALGISLETKEHEFALDHVLCLDQAAVHVDIHIVAGDEEAGFARRRREIAAENDAPGSESVTGKPAVSPGSYVTGFGLGLSDMISLCAAAGKVDNSIRAANSATKMKEQLSMSFVSDFTFAGCDDLTGLINAGAKSFGLPASGKTTYPKSRAAGESWRLFSFPEGFIQKSARSKAG